VKRIKSSIVRLLANMLAWTWRFELFDCEPKDALVREKAPFIYAIWHCELLPLVWFHRRERCTILVSAHEDGGYLAAAAERWGYRLIRGSSSRGGPAGLRGMIRALDGGKVVATTPDGPKGPAKRAKPGLLMAARAAGVPIIGVRASAADAWTFNSWDRFVLPKPFAKIRVRYAEPLYVGPDVSRSDAAKMLEDRLEGAGRC